MIHNADIPYEQRMKYIIEDYRKLYDLNERLAEYARRLEKRVAHLEGELSEKIEKNTSINNRLVEKNRECKRLLARIEFLEDKQKKQQ